MLIQALSNANVTELTHRGRRGAQKAQVADPRHGPGIVPVAYGYRWAIWRPLATDGIRDPDWRHLPMLDQLIPDPHSRLGEIRTRHLPSSGRRESGGLCRLRPT